ncbi:MAG: signal peptidase I [Oscillospiraceae bacterium]|nr:signal peptidase I [Oscillospiraceae bacterium]
MAEAQSRPTSEQLRAELNRVSRKGGGAVFGKFLLILILLILILAVLAVILLPGFVIYGNSMAPTMDEGDVVLAWPCRAEQSDSIFSRLCPMPESGDIVAFHYGERILIKRVIGCPGDSVEILADGTVVLNGNALTESYAEVASISISDVKYPCTVPENAYFVLGDNRGNSVDSRNTIIGMVSGDQVIGRIFGTVWPLSRLKLM